MKKLMGFLIILIIFGLAGRYYLINQIKVEKTYYNKVLEIERGAPLEKTFKELGLWDNIYFKLYLKQNGGKGIKAGYYSIKGDYTIEEIVAILEEGRDKLFKFTIPEGSTVKDIMKKLSKEGYGTEEELKEALEEQEFPYLTPNNNYEGYIYPETYFIPAGISEEKVWKIFLDEFLKRFPIEEYPDKEEFYEKLVLASIIEREAVAWSEKETISSVFNNRIRKGMRLESDATVNYVFNYEKKRIYYKDLEVESPYNTYKVKGLPPTPIANPDEKSIKAAMNPDETEFLFFVAKEDGSGEHHFTKTYKEHRNYIIKVRNKTRAEK